MPRLKTQIELLKGLRINADFKTKKLINVIITEIKILGMNISQGSVTLAECEDAILSIEEEVNELRISKYEEGQSFHPDQGFIYSEAGQKQQNFKTER